MGCSEGVLAQRFRCGAGGMPRNKKPNFCRTEENVSLCHCFAAGAGDNQGVWAATAGGPGFPWKKVGMASRRDATASPLPLAWHGLLSRRDLLRVGSLGVAAAALPAV